MEVTIKIEKTIENCRDCPCTSYLYEHGCCGDVCWFGSYNFIPEQGIREDCPFKLKDFIYKGKER